MLKNMDPDLRGEKYGPEIRFNIGKDIDRERDDKGKRKRTRKAETVPW